MAEETLRMEDLVKGHIYRLRSRNLACGVYDGASGFIGIRLKFDERYLFTEYYDDGVSPFGTARPKEDLGALPDDVEPVESYPGEDKMMGSVKIRTARMNKGLFDFLDNLEKNTNFE